jgi:hypothetical protein
MDKNKLIDISLVEWIASLNSRDRGAKSIKPNFEELFQKWKDLGASFDDVYETHLPKAIKAHQPADSLARSQFKKFKTAIRGFEKSEKEFIDDWKNSIDNAATESFFEFFPATPIDHDPAPKVYGSMSAAEYNAQRRYVDKYPTLSTDELVKQWKTQHEYNLDVEDALENVLGNKKDETN